MEIQKMMSNQTINLELDVTHKDEVIEKMVDMLFEDGRLLSKEGFLSDILEREQTMSTNMGEMIAIPHAKSLHVKQSSIAFARLKQPIEWSEDGKIDLVFMLAINEMHEGVSHLEVIAKLAMLLIEDEFKKSLYEINDVNSIISIIDKFNGEEL